MATGFDENRAVESESATSNACLIEKATNRLIAMGTSKPKTLDKLSATLESCTAVLPYLNPMEALELANKQSDREPALVELLNTKLKVYASHATIEGNLWERVKHLHKGKTRFAFPPADVERTMRTGLIKWIRSCPEGTKESLMEEIHQRCWRECNLDVALIIESLKGMGFLQVDQDGVVLYFLPSSRDLFDLRKTLQKQTVSSCQFGYAGYMTMVQSAAYWGCTRYSRRAKGAFIYGDTLLPATFDVAELYALCLLSEIAPNQRPRNLDVLARVLEPVRHLVYVVPSSGLLGDQSRPKSRGKRAKKPTHFAIGVVKECPLRIIPLTAEGLLGVTEASVDELNGSSENASCKRRYITGRARGFAKTVAKHLAPKLQQQNAVLVLATEGQKREIIGEVSDWLDRYRGITPGENDKQTGGSSPSAATYPHLVLLKNIERELLSLCAVQVTTIPVSSVVAMLENHGFIRIDHEDPIKPVTYLIPEVSKTTSPAWKVAVAAIWKTSVKKCYSQILARYFPPEQRSGKEDKVNPEFLDKVVEYRVQVLDTAYYARYTCTLTGLIACIVGLMVAWFGL